MALTTSQQVVSPDSAVSRLAAPNADAARRKSVVELSLLAALRIMDDCYSYIDNYFATFSPRSTSWKEEVEVVLLDRLNGGSSEGLRSIGSCTTLAFHIARSVDFICLVEKPSISTGIETQADKRQAKEEVRRMQNRPVVMMKAMPCTNITVVDAVQRMFDAAGSLLDERFRSHSDFDSFELYMRAASTILQVPRFMFSCHVGCCTL